MIMVKYLEQTVISKKNAAIVSHANNARKTHGIKMNHATSYPNIENMTTSNDVIATDTPHSICTLCTLVFRRGQVRPILSIFYKIPSPVLGSRIALMLVMQPWRMQ